MIVEWFTHVYTPGRIQALLTPIAVAQETRLGVAYRYAGRERSGRPWCFYQYTLSGQGLVRLGKDEWRVTAGAGFLCHTHDPQLEYGFPANAVEPWRFIYISFVGRMAKAVVKGITERYGPVHPLPPDEGIMPRLLDFERYADGVCTLSPSEGHRLISGLIADILKHHEDRLEVPGHFLVSQAVREIQRSAAGPLNVTELARRLKVSREHLTRCFTRKVGITPYQFMLQQRVDVAKDHLRNTTLTAEQIAHRLGFKSAAQFNLVFKRVVGQTPGGWRAGAE